MDIFNRYNLSDNAAKLTKNIVWAVSGKIVTLLGSFIIGIFVARYLGPEQFGLMNYVIAYITIFQVLATFGLDNIEIREEAKNKEERDAILGTALTIKLVFSIIAILAIVVTIMIVETDSFTRWMILLYSTSMIFNSFFIVRNYFTAIVWNEYVVKSEIMRTIVGVLIKVFLLVIHASLAWFIFAAMLDYVLLASGYCLSYSRKIDSIKLWRFDWKWAKYLIRQSFPLLLTSAAVIIYQRIDQVMIKNMLDEAAVGQFSVAGKFVEVLIFIPIMICQTVAPMLVQTRDVDKEQYKKNAQIFMNLTIWSSVVISLVMSVLSYVVIRYTFGEAYLLAVPILQVLSFKTVAVALSNTAGQLIIIEGLQDYAILRDGTGCIVCVLLNYALIPVLGTVGSAIVAIISNFVAGYVTDLFVPKYRHFFKMQTKAIFFGWKDIFRIKEIVK